MSATSGRERVVQKYDPRGVWCAALLWGVPLGYFIEDVAQAVEDAFGRRWPNAVPILLIHFVVMWYAVVPLMLARVSPRMRWMLFAAIATNVGFFCASFVRSMVGRVGFGADPSVPVLHLPQLIAFTATSTIAAAVALAVWRLYRWLRFVPVEQREDGSLCIACGYEMGPADPCPECGTKRAGARPRGRRIDAAWRLLQWAARPAAAVLVLLTAGYFGYRYWYDYLPTREFVAKFGVGQTPAYAFVDVLPAGVQRGSTFAGAVAYTVDLADGTERMLLVSFNNCVPRGLPAMQIRMAAPAPGWPVRPQRWLDWGIPETIVADLNREQAEHVIRKGLSRSLVDAITAKADEVGWRAGGGMGAGGPRLVINAAPYFAEKSNRE